MPLLPSKRTLHRLSREPAFLAKLAAALLGLGILLTWLTAVPGPVANDPADGPPSLAADPDASPREQALAFLDLLRHLTAGEYDVMSGHRPELMKLAGLGDADSALLAACFAAMMGDGSPDPLRKALAAPEADAFTAALAGDGLRVAGTDEEALAAYDKGTGTDDPAGRYCRRRSMELCAARSLTEALRERLARPGWREALVEAATSSEADATLIAAGDWPGLLAHSWAHVRRGLGRHPWPLVAAVAAIVWFVTLMGLFGVPPPHRWTCLLAVLLGALSVVPTLAMVMWQKNVLPVAREDGWLQNLIYCVSGVGLREELAKLLLFLPLLPLLRKASPGSLFAAASCVGLGFAAEENINYLGGSLGSASLARFCTANLLHIALTGMAGGFLGLAIRYPRSFFNEFSVTLVGVIVAHGVYDWGLTAAFADGDAIAWFTFLGVILAFFKARARFADRRPRVISLPAVWITGTALVGVTTMLAIGRVAGFGAAVDAVAIPMAALFSTAALIVWQLRHE